MLQTVRKLSCMPRRLMNALCVGEIMSFICGASLRARAFVMIFMGMDHTDWSKVRPIFLWQEGDVCRVNNGEACYPQIVKSICRLQNIMLNYFRAIPEDAHVKPSGPGALSAG